ncbi:Sterol 3-beta-glucosyltransferase UGT80A2 [Hibiscus syriacus]|uniref:Sterol 3-beta-glucosyltransferase UGT80A2 n=1 Tax=Hibiscus syriacus TaxID=106335 RepID=A0A6A2XRX7_HIBSY|nr:Sterol 3-beta-glucosyltransferase UGT80A2 [Hibiscus syriacus]
MAELPEPIGLNSIFTSSDLPSVAISSASEEHVDSEYIPDIPPPLQIVMLIVGTRGDVQPFVAIGKRLQPVEEPERMSQIIVQALEKTGQRGIINKGWGGLGNCPSRWSWELGTTAAGLKAGCPTTIVPFFGDQPFWGERVHGRGVGPAPIPVEEFSLDKLVHAIHFMLDPEVKFCAVELAKDMEGEDGVAGAVKAFYEHFPGKWRGKSIL